MYNRFIYYKLLVNKMAKGSKGRKIIEGLRLNRKRNFITRIEKKVKAGRPKGSFKHGMPIQQWKKLQSKKREQLRQFRQAQLARLSKRGLTPDDVRRAQLDRTLERGPPNPTEGIADEELKFQQWLARNRISPNTQKILHRLRRTQLKGQRDDVNQQRVHQERRMVQNAGNLMRAHETLHKVEMDFTGVDPETNILMAPNQFKENPENNILKKRRGNILDTASYGNNLFF